jgi:hypothetical protein
VWRPVGPEGTDQFDGERIMELFATQHPATTGVEITALPAQVA